MTRWNGVPLALLVGGIWIFLSISAVAQAPQPGQHLTAELVRATQKGERPIATKACLCILLAQMADAEKDGQNVEDFVRRLIVSERIPAYLVESISDSLFSSWKVAHDLGLLTPENLVRLRSGQGAIVSEGSDKGDEIGMTSEHASIAPDLELYTFTLASRSTGPRAAANIPSYPTSRGGYPVSPVQSPPVVQRRPGQGPVPQSRSWPMSQGPQLPDDLSGVVRKVAFVDIGPNEAVKLTPFGGGTAEIFVNAARPQQGIAFSMVDPARMVVRRSNYDGSIMRTPNAKPAFVPWQDDPIPGTSEKGTYLTSYNGIDIYFVDTSAGGQNHFRIAILYPDPDPAKQVVPLGVP